MPKESLKQLGLTESEIEVYLCCLSLGQCLISTIARHTKIKRTSLYAITERLSKSGFLSSIKQNNTQYFIAADPETLEDRCKQNVHNAQQTLRQIQDSIPLLKQLTNSDDKVSVQYFEGLDGVKVMLEDVIKENCDVCGIVSIKDVCKPIRSYLDGHYTKQRSAQNTKSRVIYLKDKESIEYFKQNYGNNSYLVRIVERDILDLKISIHIYAGKVAFYSVSDEKNLHGVIIQSKTIYHSIQSIFNALFDMLKPKK